MKKFPRDNTNVTGLEPLSSDVEEVCVTPKSQVLKKVKKPVILTVTSEPSEDPEDDTLRLSRNVLSALSEASESSDFSSNSKGEMTPIQHPIAAQKGTLPDWLGNVILPRAESLESIKVPEDLLYYLDTHPRWEFVEKSIQAHLWCYNKKNEFLIISRLEGKTKAPVSYLERIARIEGRELGSVFVDLLFLIKGN